MNTRVLLRNGTDFSGEVVWGANGSTIYYTTLDEEHRPNKVWRHTMGSPQSSDKLLLTEDDELFWIDLDKSCSGRFLIVRTSSPDTSEVHLLDLTAAGAEKADLKLVNKRVKDHRYLHYAPCCILSLCVFATDCIWLWLERMRGGFSFKCDERLKVRTAGAVSVRDLPRLRLLSVRCCHLLAMVV